MAQSFQRCDRLFDDSGLNSPISANLRITSRLPVTRQGSRAVREGPRNEHTAIGLAPRSSRFQKPEGVASKFAR